MNRTQGFTRLLSDPGKLVSHATVTVYVAGTTRLATIYADNAVPPTPRANPFTSDSHGYWFFYAAPGRYDVQLSGGSPSIPTPYKIPADQPVGVGDSGVLSYTRTALPASGVAANAARLARVTDSVRGLWMDTGQQWFDLNGEICNVKEFGAIGNGVADDTSAIQAAIDAAVALGGARVWFPPGNYRITAALVVVMGAPTVGIGIIGSGVAATTITQATTGADIFQVGTNSLERADNIRIADLNTVGGNYALNLNNALQGKFERLRLTSCAVGIYTRGQNEGHVFRDINIDGWTTNGIYCGASNGSSGAELDHPEIQKCRFDNIRIANGSGGSAFIITASLYGGAQQVSGALTLTRILLEGNNRSGLEIRYSFNTSIDGFSNEDHPDTNNVYTALLVDNQSTVYVSHCQIWAGTGPNNYAYLVTVQSGTLMLSEAFVTGPGVGGDIFVNDTFVGHTVFIINAATLVFSNTAARRRAVLINLRDSSGVPIIWPSDYAFVTIETDSAVSGNLRVSGALKVSATTGIAARPLHVLGASTDEILARMQTDSGKNGVFEFYQGTMYRGELDADGTSVSIYNSNGGGPNDNNGVHVMQSGAGGSNWGFFTRAAADFGNGAQVIAIRNAFVIPTANPVNGGILYSTGGALHWLSPGGTNTTVAPNDPHCEKCGRDFVLEWKSEKFGHLQICMWCASEALAAGVLLRDPPAR